MLGLIALSAVLFGPQFFLGEINGSRSALRHDRPAE